MPAINFENATALVNETVSSLPSAKETLQMVANATLSILNNTLNGMNQNDKMDLNNPDHQYWQTTKSNSNEEGVAWWNYALLVGGGILSLGALVGCVYCCRNQSCKTGESRPDPNFEMKYRNEQGRKEYNRTHFDQK